MKELKIVNITPVSKKAQGPKAIADQSAFYQVFPKYMKSLRLRKSQNILTIPFKISM